jgi:hypothetical protein
MTLMRLYIIDKIALAAITLYPPHDTCVNPDCPSKLLLKKEKPREAFVFTLANGVQPSWAIFLRC